MPKLTVEESGKRRSFNVSDGRLSVGSGSTAKLRLSAPGVAEIHLELDFEGGSARVHPRPGVLPPELDGRAMPGEFRLAPGRVLKLGGARLWIEGAREQAPSKAAPAPRPKKAKSGPRTPKTTHSERSVVRRTKPRVRRGLPGWSIVLLVLAGVAFAFLLTKRALEGEAAKGTSSVWAAILSAEERMETGDLDLAETKLEEALERQDPTPEEGQRIAALLEDIQERRVGVELDLENMRGTAYLDKHLKPYETRYLSGDPEPSKVRLFLLYCRDFRASWPEHPEMSWVERQERRFAGFVDLEAEPTWKELEWEIEYLVAGKPRNYALAFQLLDGFQGRATDKELLQLQMLLDRLVEERAEHHTDRIYEAEYRYNKKNDAGKAVWWLIHEIIWSGDEEMATEAAAFLVKIPNLDDHLRGYEKKYPEKYAAVLEHPMVRLYAEERGLLP